MTDPFSELNALLGPLCWGHPHTTLNLTYGPGQHIEVRLALKPAVEPASDEEARDALWSAAQHAIRKVEGAGWQHVRYPETTISGQIQRQPDRTTHGILAEGTLRLDLVRLQGP